MAQRNDNTWLHQVQARGWGDFLHMALDVLEPLGPLGAQLVWVAQPALSLFVGREALGRLAEALDEPGGVARLREEISDLSYTYGVPVGHQMSDENQCD